MPELPEVEITRQKLWPLVRGRRILDFWTDWPRGLRAPGTRKRIAADMRGRKILGLTRRGKVLFFKLSGQPERAMAVHLGMSGRLETSPVEPRTKSKKVVVQFPRSWKLYNKVLPRKVKWVHFRWFLSSGKDLLFVDLRKFGRVWYGSLKELDSDKYLGRLGSDTQAMTLGEFRKTLEWSRGMIKPLLLRQDKFAGIGNIIADESLWRARIHPGTHITHLDSRQRRRLYQGIQQTIRIILASGGTSLRNWGHPDGRIGGYQEKRLIYGKAGWPCPRCSETLRRIVVGGRGTSICPHCQKLRGLLPGVKR